MTTDTIVPAVHPDPSGESSVEVARARAPRDNLGRRCRYRGCAAMVAYAYTDADLVTVDDAGRTLRLAPAGLVDLITYPRGLSPEPVSSVLVADEDWLE
jgi:hypothetical protein